MGFLPPLCNDTVVFFLGSSTLECSWIQSYGIHKPFVLKGYRSIPLRSGVVYQSRLFNPTTLEAHMKAFLQTYNLRHPFAVFGIDGLGLPQEFQVASPSENYHTDLQERKKYQGRYYLYPYDDARGVSYVVECPYEYIMQYQILARNVSLNLLTLTTSFMAYVRLYRQVYGSAFRRVQLARDMQKYNNQLGLFFTREMLQRLMHIPVTLSLTAATQRSLVTALGLFLLGGACEDD